MVNKKIRITLHEVLIYLTLALFCMQFFISNYSIRFFVTVDSLGLKHIMMAATIAVGFISDLRHGRLKIRAFTYETKMILTAAVSLILITFVYMAFNGIADYWISQIYFILVPLFFAYSIFRNDRTVERFKSIVNFTLFVVSVYYLIYIIQRVLTGNLIMEFSFVNSKSPFENEVAHFFLLMYIFYTFNGDYKRRAVSAVFCILAWKRLCIVYFVFITIVGLMRMRNKKVKTGYMIVMALLFTVLGVMMQYVISDSFGRWFNEITGLNFVDFSNFRYYTIRRAVMGEVLSNGLGSFFSIRVPWYGRYVDVSIHNDLLRLYLEVSVIGLFLYLMFTGIIAKRRFSVFVILYLFIEMAGSHMLGNGGIPFWFMAYTLIFYFNRYDRDGLGNVYPVNEADSERQILGHFSINKGKITIKRKSKNI